MDANSGWENKKVLRFYEIAPSGHPSYYWAEYPQPNDKRTYKVMGVRKRGDVVSDYVWSTRMVDVLRKCKATGYSASLVKVLRNSDELRDYMRIRVTGKGGPLDRERSRAIMWKDESIFTHDAVYMDAAKWDGSDLFKIPELGGRMFAVERVVNELKRIKPTNVSFIMSTKCSLP